MLNKLLFNLFFLTGTIVGLGFIAIAWGSYFHHKQIAENGIKAQGLVIDKSYFETKDDEGMIDKHYRVKYSFPVAQELIQRSWDIRKERWNNIAVGSSILIVYDPKDPWQGNFPDGESTFLQGGIPMALFMSLLGLIVGGMFSLPLIDQLIEWKKKKI